MCKHRYFLIKTKIVRLKTSFCSRQITTDYFECKNCKKQTFVKKEVMADKHEIPPLTILDYMN